MPDAKTKTTPKDHTPGPWAVTIWGCIGLRIRGALGAPEYLSHSVAVMVHGRL